MKAVDKTPETLEDLQVFCFFTALTAIILIFPGESKAQGLQNFRGLLFSPQQHKAVPYYNGELPQLSENTSQDLDAASIQLKQGISLIINEGPLKLGDEPTPLKNGSTIKTMTHSMAELSLGSKMNLRIAEKSLVDFNPYQIKLRKGLIRLRVGISAPPCFVELSKIIKVRLEPGSDTILYHSDQGSGYVIPLQGLNLISTQEGVETLATKPGTSPLIMMEQSPDPHQARFFIFPGQVFKFHKEQAQLLYNGYIDMEVLFNKVAPELLANPENVAAGQKDFKNFRMADSPIDVVLSKSESKDSFKLGQAWMLLGLSSKAQSFLAKGESQDKSCSHVTRHVESLLIQKKWKPLAALWSPLFSACISNYDKALALYYRGVSYHLQGRLFTAEDDFIEVLSLDQENKIRDSAQRFMDYYKTSQENTFTFEGYGINSNNVLKIPQGEELPEEIQHRASSGMQFKSRFGYTLAKDESYQIRLTGHLDSQYWLKYGLNEQGLSHAFIKPVFTGINQNIPTFRIAPYLGKSMIGGHGGLDHFGLQVSYLPSQWGSISALGYDHSKNLDPAPNDSSFRDVYDGDFVDSEDRSVQRQILFLTWQLSRRVQARTELIYAKYRYEGAQDDNFFALLLKLVYENRITSNISYEVLWNLKVRKSSARTDIFIKFGPSLSYRLDKYLSVALGSHGILNLSDSSLHNFKELSFFAGLRLSF